MRWQVYVAVAFAVLGWADRTYASFIAGLGSPSAAVPGGTAVNFEGNATGTTTAALTVGGVTIDPNGQGNYFIDGFYGGSFNTTGNSLQNGGFAGNTTSFRFTFAELTDAFAFNFGANDYTWQ